MPTTAVIGALSVLSRDNCGVFRGRDAGLSRRQLYALRKCGAIDRLFPDVFCMTSVAPTSDQLLRGALMWAGDGAYASGLSAGERYRCEDVRAAVPEITVPITKRLRSDSVVVHCVANRTIDHGTDRRRRCRQRTGGHHGGAREPARRRAVRDRV